MAMHLPWSLIEEEAWFETMIKHPPDERILCIEARLGDGWLLIGSCAFVNIDWRSRASEFGIMIGEKAANRLTITDCSAKYCVVPGRSPTVFINRRVSDSS